MENNRVKISVHEGKLIGIVEKNVYNNSYIAFRGIPYAKPPIGELRFKFKIKSIIWVKMVLHLSPMSVENHSSSKSLFHKAIPQSGVMACPWAFTEREPHTKNMGFLLAKKLGKPTADPKVAYEFLKTIDAKKLIETQEKSLVTERQNLLMFTPTLDHESSNPAFPENLETFIHRGVNVPLLLGFTSCEGSLIMSNTSQNRIGKEELKKFDSDFTIAITPRVLSILPKIPITVEELRSIYFGDKAVSEETLINYVNFIGDELFCRSIMEVTDIQTKLNRNNNNATYLYKFSYESETSFTKKLFNITLPGVTHGEELPYLFYSNMMKDFGLSPPAPDSEDYKMMNCLTQMWTDFAKTGNPTPITNLWLPVTNSQKGNYNYLNIDKISQMKVFRKGEESWDWKENKNKSQH
ncbi:juvenile hormone esterase-like [Pogonomyrmex barbatus]|uniref:Juvenile hormone esterase-like n=1 Tax=Pogonomyrmex barbatus TaxID=144034 RepID=A0A6I9VQH2_9HYME|nr:juvenile hormone esterase-like [Pogonomyrmex barbatus]